MTDDDRYIEPRPNGRFRVRILTASGHRENVGTFDTIEQARAERDAKLVALSQMHLISPGGVTLRGIANDFLDARERDLGRAIQPDRSRWRIHVAKAPFYDVPIRAITRRVVREWAKRLPLSRSGALLVVSVLSQAFEWAIDAGNVDENPARGVRLPRRTATHEPWTFLDPEEQRRLVSAVPEPQRWLVLFALGTGMRKGELWGLRLADLHLDVAEPHVVVRHGTLHGPTKGRKIRILQLAPSIAEAGRRWLESLPAYLGPHANPLGLVFPNHLGSHRRTDRPAGWWDWVKAANLGRPFRFHDLRHSCGASLVSGWWGRAWTLQEVRDYLGHSTIRMTERYAHLGPTALKLAVRGTMGPSLELARPRNPELPTSTARASDSPVLSVGLVPEGTSQGRSAPQLTAGRPTKAQKRAALLEARADALAHLDRLAKAEPKSKPFRVAFAKGGAS